MATFLDELLPCLFPGIAFKCVPHQGKRALKKSIPRKIKGWPPGTRFVVVQDQDQGDCHQVKSDLVELCRKAGRDDVLVRVVCRELEAWYLGAPAALKAAFPDQRGIISRELRGSRYRNPDTVQNPAEALAELIPTFQKVSAARQLGESLSQGDNTSHSFKVFLDGVAELHASMQTEA